MTPSPKLHRFSIAIMPFSKTSKLSQKKSVASQVFLTLQLPTGIESDSVATPPKQVKKRNGIGMLQDRVKELEERVRHLEDAVEQQEDVIFDLDKAREKAHELHKDAVERDVDAEMRLDRLLSRMDTKRKAKNDLSAFNLFNSM